MAGLVSKQIYPVLVCRTISGRLIDAVLSTTGQKRLVQALEVSGSQLALESLLCVVHGSREGETVQLGRCLHAGDLPHRG